MAKSAEEYRHEDGAVLRPEVGMHAVHLKAR